MLLRAANINRERPSFFATAAASMARRVPREGAEKQPKKIVKSKNKLKEPKKSAIKKRRDALDVASNYGTSMVLRSGRKRNFTIEHLQTKKRRTVAVSIRHRQSPIDIRTDVVCHDPRKCQAQSLCISYVSGDCCDVTTSAAGFRVNVGMNCTTSLSSSHLPGEFQLAQFHAHWSGDGSCGSEHLLNGKAMSGEVHFVFWNKKYANFCEAAEKDDGLAVLGAFLKEGEYSEEYQPLFDVVQRAIGSEQPVPMPKDFTLNQLLPERHDFVTYLGSLTTPPYTESVIWTVLIEPIEVSKDQLDVLRAIVLSNFRECQDLCERAVLASTAISAR